MPLCFVPEVTQNPVLCRYAFFQESDDTNRDGRSAVLAWKKQGLEEEQELMPLRLETGKLTDTQRTPTLLSVVTQGFCLLNPLLQASNTITVCYSRQSSKKGSPHQLDWTAYMASHLFNVAHLANLNHRPGWCKSTRECVYCRGQGQSRRGFHVFVFFCSKDSAGYFLHCLAMTVLWLRGGKLWQPTVLVQRAQDLVSSLGMVGHPVNQNHNYFSEYEQHAFRLMYHHDECFQALGYLVLVCLATE